MYLTSELLEKLNAHTGIQSGTPDAEGKTVTLPDIMVRSFAELKQLAGDSLTWGEKNFLYQQAQKELKENRMAESRILSRANPQLRNAVRLGIRQSAMLGGYDDLFPQRASRFVKPGSVASMFSPAGYLTELYREARGLHGENSPYYLDTRRPDLASLSLSQKNMDDELSTLSLSNELLLNTIQSGESLSYDDVIEKLATYRQTGSTPFHLPYETSRQAVLLQDPAFRAFRNNPEVAAKMDTSNLLGITASISPDLHSILTEEITEANADELFKKNFGDIAPPVYLDKAYLARWYGLSYDEMNSLASLLGRDSTVNSNTPPGSYYENDLLVKNVLTDEDGKTIIIKRSYSFRRTPDFCLEIIPTEFSGDKYTINIVVPESYKGHEVGCRTIRLGSLRGNDLSYNVAYKELQEVIQPGQVISLDGNLVADDKDIYLSCTFTTDTTDTIGFYTEAVANFTVFEMSFKTYLLKLNKLIRLYKATGISPADIRTVIESVNADLSITDDVLSRLFWANYYAQLYRIDFSSALVLAGATIGQIAHRGQDSAFNRLFNTPPLNNQLFYADGTVLDLAPGRSEDTFRTGVLKRALQVDDTGLYTLYTLTFTDKDSEDKAIDFTLTIDNLSALYRTRLLALVNNLSVTELSLLLSVSPYAHVKLNTLKDDKLNELSTVIERYMLWLNHMNWTVSDLYLMLTDRFSTTLSPDIENLIDTLKNGLPDLPSSGDDAGVITAVAPFIAAASQLDSAETAAALLQWLNQLKPKEQTVTDFLALVNNDNRNDEQTTQLVIFCQVMGQLALFVRSSGLNAAELSWMVTHPDCLRIDYTVLKQDIETLQDISGLHAFLGRCGSHASEILTSLSGKAGSEKDNLAVKTVATALMLDETMLAQGIKQVSAYEYFYNWNGLEAALQWLDVASTFGITPADVARMVALRYSGKNASPYADWVTVSHALQAGLNAQQTVQLQASLDESLSAAVSAYVIKNMAPDWVTDRDTLYSWLLIDNQVSAQVKTTRIAEAIASVQLYVNRALTGQEQGVVSAVKSKPFFTSDWDTCNKRYSTWAGVSELVYYPENYVDPTLRLGQTGMMDEMLQTLSQSQLTFDSVEEAFKTYMTRFEEIANLEVISGYHDSVSDQNGITYIIGRSALGDYYWRSADIRKMSDGKLPASGWTEWKKITAAAIPVANLMRPVIFGSRFHIVWVESKETAKKDGDNITKTTDYQLKYAHILHDGSWSSPVSVKLKTEILPLNSLTDIFVDITNTGIYCAHDTVRDCIFISFYEKQQKQTKESNKNITGLLIHADGTITYPDEFPEYFYSQFDTTDYTCLNTQVIQPSVTKVKSLDPKWGESKFSFIKNSPITVTSAVLADDDINFTLEPEARLVFSNLQQKSQVDALKKIASTGDIVLLGSVYKKYELPEYDDISFIDISAVTLEKVKDDSVEYVTYVTPLYYDPGESWENAYTESSFKVVYNKDDVTAQTKYDKTTNSWVYTCDTAPDFISALFFSQPNEDGDVVWMGGFESSEMVEIDTATMKAQVEVLCGKEKLLTVDSEGIKSATWDETLFNFSDTTITVPQSYFTNGAADIYYEASVLSGNAFFGSETLTCTINLGKDAPVIKLCHTAENAQYLQYGAHRIRVNTLFAKQLVSRANAGLDAVLSMDTQQLGEPKLGEGVYVHLELNPYSKKINGDSREFNIKMVQVLSWYDSYVLASGILDANQPVSVSFFLPRIAEAFGNTDNLYLTAQYQNGKTNNIRINKNSDNKWQVDTSYNKGTFPGLKSITLLNGQNTEPMDFNGANALYFWEMFYYVPMMVFKRLLSEGRFTEATRWIQYIWSPDGYLQNDQPAAWTWNVRPLEEETAWHANPLDSTDPDAVAQADPLHYKVATFMAYLDLLIARGDAAYRQLERDTLNEAKMWYVQALNILGNEPYLPAGSGWTSPRLSDAADKTTQKNVQQALMAVRQQLTSGELRTANSLTGLFLPQQNEKLAGYWQTLAQRLYNLRHNLSIDGSPLSLAIYAAPADPGALLSAAVNSASGGSDLPAAVMPLYRFPVILDSARGMVSQLTQFGSTLLSLTERRDAEALSELLQTQGSQLIVQSIALQNSAITEIDAEKTALDAARDGAQSRLESYTSLYDEDVNTGERQAMDLALAASVLSTTATVSYTVAAGLDAAPNIYGMAFGGSRYGSIARAVGTGIEIGAMASRSAAERLGQSEAWRRRRQEWDIQRNNADAEMKQIDARLASLAVRREGAVLQKTYLETQQSQMQAQLTFLQNKFTSKALYNWLRGRLAAIYYQFYDLTVSRCLMAQEAYKWGLGIDSASFIRPGAWQGTYAGLMAGETLMLNLAQMEQGWLLKDQRAKEVTRTVCLSEFYSSLDSDFNFESKINALLSGTAKGGDTNASGLSMSSDKKQLQATLTLSDLKIRDDYPESLGKTRRIRQISVTLPALVGPYQDVRAVLSYGDPKGLAKGCDALAVSHGMNDSGQFQLDFNDGRWLPFEGITVDSSGVFTLSFPGADGSQKALLQTLTDIILHIRYTIIS